MGLGQNTPQIDVAETAHHPSFRVHADSSQDLSEDWTEPRCLFVGIGGLAIKAMVALRQSLLAGSSESAKAVLEEHQWLALDTDCTELEQALDSPQGGLAPKDIVAIPVLHPRDYRSSEPELFSPISRRWLYNIPRTLVTEGVRPLSILTFLQHYNDVRAAIVEAVNTLCRTNIALGVPRDNIRVYVMSSMHGGTGSGLLAEVGLLIRKILIDRDCANCTVSGYGTVATAVNNGNVNLASAAAIATLSEISYFMSANQLAQPLFYRDRLAGPNRFKPFDWFTLVDGGLLGDSDDCRAAAIELAKLVQLDALTTCGASLDSIRTADRAQPEGWLRTATMRRVQLVEKMDVDALKRTRPIVALEKIINHVSSNSEPDNLSAAVKNAELNSWELRCSEFADQVLASIGLVAPSNSVAEEIATANGRRKLQIWTRRLSGNEELKQLQMADDLRQIQNALLHLLEMQKCTCQQIELVQLAIIERMVGFCESSPLPLARYLSDFKEQFGSEEQIIATCIKYCHELVDRSVARNRRFHEARLRLAKQFSAWKRTLQSEPGCLLQFDTPDEDTDASYATKLFDAALFPALLQHTSQALKAAFTEPVDADASTCKPLAPLHFDAWLSTTEAIARELSAKFNDSTDEPSGPQAMPAKDLGSLLPPLANTGGTVTRLVCCPEQGVSTIDRQLKKLGVAETTLVIPRKDQLETFALCEAADINLAAIARVLWRPNAETFQVAERLRTRVDVEWIPASELGSKPI
ncbi:MAG: hypothetical protein KDB22_10565 [Planctomycetales bacterium]|nr:hypothetical protein [Planctomycetales bacterium]